MLPKQKTIVNYLQFIFDIRVEITWKHNSTDFLLKVNKVTNFYLAHQSACQFEYDLWCMFNSLPTSQLAQ